MTIRNLFVFSPPLLHPLQPPLELLLELGFQAAVGGEIEAGADKLLRQAFHIGESVLGLVGVFVALPVPPGLHI